MINDNNCYNNNISNADIFERNPKAIVSNDREIN